MSIVSESILREYPHPIAKCYEKLLATRSTVDHWVWARSLFEVTVKYCAAMAAARYLHNDVLDERTNNALKNLNRPTLEDWYRLFVACARHNQSLDSAFLGKEVFDKIQKVPNLIDAARTMRQQAGMEVQAKQSESISSIFAAFVSYQTRIAMQGHPSDSDIEALSPLLNEACVELLESLPVLRRVQLLFLSEISLDRSAYVHSLTKLMGTSPITLSDYVVADSKEALIGHDRKLFLTDFDDTVPFVTLHPFAIYSSENVFLLKQSDLQRNVDYYCYSLGEVYSADRIFEDFKDSLGAFLVDQKAENLPIDLEAIYREAVRVSLTDNVISPEEMTHLENLQAQLGLQDVVAREIEQILQSERPRIETVNSSILALEDTTNTGEDAVRLLFISYSSVGNSFWADFVSRLASAANLRDWVFSIVTPDPGEDHDAAAMASLVVDLDHTIKRHRPSIIVLVPFPSSTFTTLFQSRMSQNSVPVVTIDTDFLTSDIDETSSILPPCIMIDNEVGGELAADVLLQSTVKEAPRFLVMPGIDESPHSQARLTGFKNRILAEHPDARVRVLPEGRFNRYRAKVVFDDFLEDVELERYDGVFCCNDDMALGVYSSVSRYINATEFKEVQFVIVGFNNTAEFCSVAEADPHGVLLASVDQALGDYVGQLVDVVEMMLSGQTPGRRYLIQPSIKSD